MGSIVSEGYEFSQNRYEFIKQIRYKQNHALISNDDGRCYH
jgi:hypothetical protein